MKLNHAQSETIRYTVFASGNSQFFEAASIPLAECLENVFVGDDSTVFTSELPEYLSVDSRPRADGGVVLAGIVGVFAFLTTWLAKKVLDDVYEMKLRPSIRKALGEADKGLEGANASKPKLLIVGVSYADRKIAILIGIIGDSFDEILESEQMVRTVHANAVQWADANPTDCPIHLYIVDRGTTNIEPMLYNDLSSVNQYISEIDHTKKQT